MILSIPPGKVSTYGGVAAAAGYPRYHRAVAWVLRSQPCLQIFTLLLQSLYPDSAPTLLGFECRRGFARNR